jgi:hypothetical protein
MRTADKEKAPEVAVGGFQLFPVSPDYDGKPLKCTGSERRILDLRILDFRILDSGYWTLDIGFWILDFDIGSCLSDIKSELVYLEYIKVPKPSWSKPPLFGP